MFYIISRRTVSTIVLKCHTLIRRDTQRKMGDVGNSVGSVGNNVIKTFIFFDLETTGLPTNEGNRTKITELVFIAVQADHLKKGVFPRVQSKLSLCFHPQKRITDVSEEITGLGNLLLENLPTFSENTVELLDNFVNYQPKPVCLVAHNGNMFDFPILKAEILKTGRSLTSEPYCIDSLLAFREILSEEENSEQDLVDFSTSLSDELLVEVADKLDKSANEPFVTETEKALHVQKINETTPKKPDRSMTYGSNPSKKVRTNLFPTAPIYFKPGFKLKEIFEKLVPAERFRAHMAENDVVMLLKCAVAKHSEFISWANENKRKLEEIPHMEPGKKIGTCQPIF